MQRLRQAHGIHVPGTVAYGSHSKGASIDQYRREQVRTQVCGTVHEYRIVVLAGEPRAWKSDEVRAHAGGGLFGNFQQASGWGAIDERRRVAVGGNHRCQAVVTPGRDDQVGQGTDHARYAHGQRPGQGNCADQVVQVEPAQAAGLFVAHGAERQTAHERRIEHGAGDNRDDEQHAHEGQQQLAGQAGEHVHVQAQHDHHEAAIGSRHGHRFAGAGVEHEGVRRIGFGAGGGGGYGHYAVGFVLVVAEVLHDLAGAVLLGLDHQLLQVEVWCIGRHFPQFGGVAEQVFEFVVEDQRQAGECQQQQEQGTDQAAPGMDHGPAADGWAFHHGTDFCLLERGPQSGPRSLRTCKWRWRQHCAHRRSSSSTSHR
ncbi:hypothetical protein D3C80_718850 [compost metagenome]